MAAKPTTVVVSVLRTRPGFSNPFEPGAQHFVEVTLTLIKVVATEEKPWALGGSDRAYDVYEGDVLLGQVSASYGHLNLAPMSSRLRRDGARRLLWSTSPVRKADGSHQRGAHDLTSRKHGLEILARGY